MASETRAPIGRARPSRFGLRTRALAGATVLALAVAAQLAARSHSESVEAIFSTGLYPRLGGRLGEATRLVPFSVAETIVVATFAGLLGASARAVYRVLKRETTVTAVLARSSAHTLLLGGGGYALFLLLWGFNYARLPLARIARLPTAPGPTSELRMLATDLVSASNEARVGLTEDEAGVLRIPGSFESVAARAALGFRALPLPVPLLPSSGARPKAVWLSPLLSRLGITGIYSPFTGEANVNVTVPDVELPFSAAHELAHQQGFAREDEANFLAYAACRNHPDPDFRYAGLLAASHYAVGALDGVDRAAARSVEAGRSPAVRRDDAAIRAWVDRYYGRATEVGHRVNDAFLRAQGQKEGIRSYGRMVDLLLAERRARPAVPGVPP